MLRTCSVEDYNEFGLNWRASNLDCDYVEHYLEREQLKIDAQNSMLIDFNTTNATGKDYNITDFIFFQKDGSIR